MAEHWTTDQVTGMAPDSASLKSGQKLAVASKWTGLGRSAQALWGTIQGSGGEPYQVQIDLSGPAFKCSCPSRKFPCKHALGLALVFAELPNALAESAPPDWALKWFESRAQRAESKAQKAAIASAPVDEATEKKRAEAQKKREQARSDKVDQGVEDLRRLLRDLTRQGLASQSDQSFHFWEEMALRMVDAQAEGLAKRLRDLASLPYTGTGWEDRFLDRLGRLHLLLEAYRRLDSLPEEQQADVRTQVGFREKKERILTLPSENDRYWVLGRRIELEENLRVQRTWLRGEQSQKNALILHFAPGSQPLDISLVPGTCVQAELVYYPSAWPLRALVKEQSPCDSDQVSSLLSSLHPGVSEAFAEYASALSLCPWLERYPLGLKEVIPVCQETRWSLIDSRGQQLPLALGFSGGWKLVALSGGAPISLFGEWDGEAFYPLSVWASKGISILAAPQPQDSAAS